MSSNASCNLLKDVKPYKTGWRIRLKMLHSWKQNFGGETLECILADETIPASCKRSQIGWAVSTNEPAVQDDNQW
ncbi:unnamed protein product [Brassica oleracea var. botrytis]